jgi:Raf kinase inhibitor-like YbhB/YbcL family protein
MSHTFSTNIEGWKDGAAIPQKFALGKQDSDSHVALTDNLNPAISWKDAPAGTKSFAIICCDPDVPSSGEDVNQEGKVVPADLPRIDFYHWVLVDIPVGILAINEGEASSGVTPKGKPFGQKTYGVAGINDYTLWFDGDADMGGNYGDYDGPCPPWNDSIMHHYYFTVYALDVTSVGLTGDFTGADAVSAISNHVLAQSTVMGTYTLNPDL